MTKDAATTTGQGGAAENQPLRVMIVDDSSVVRGLLTRLLETQPDVVVASSVSDGQMAVNALRRTPVMWSFSTLKCRAWTV